MTALITLLCAITHWTVEALNSPYLSFLEKGRFVYSLKWHTQESLESHSGEKCFSAASFQPLTDSTARNAPYTSYSGAQNPVECSPA